MVPSPLPRWDNVHHPQSMPYSSYEEAAQAQTLEEKSSRMHILVQDGLSAIAEWRHFSRQSRLASSSSTVWVLYNVRESSTTDIIFVSQRNSSFSGTVLLLCLCISQTWPELYATITISAGTCVCWQNALPHHSVDTNSPSLWKLCPVALSGVGDHEKHLGVTLQGNRSKLPHAVQGHHCPLTGLHWDHHRCLIWFKREACVQQVNNKWLKLPAMLDWQTHSPYSDLALFTGYGEQES